MRLSQLAATSVVVLVLSLPALAHAGAVTRTDSVITYQSSAITGVAENLNVGFENPTIFLSEEHGVTSNDCTPAGPTRVDCMPAPAIVVNFLAFNDTLVTDLLTGAFTIEAHG